MFKHRSYIEIIMRRIIISSIAIVALGTLAAFTTLEAPNWTIDKVHSAVTFEIRHFFSPVPGTFDAFDGEIKFSPDDLEGSSVSFTIDVTSVNTKNERRDGHLQSPDFFDAAKFPKMTFQSKKFTPKGNNEFVITGDLTLKDVTKTVEVPAKFLGAMDNPMKEGTVVAGLEAEFKINRTEYGVGTGNYAATSVIGDEVEIGIKLEVNRNK